MKIRLQPQETTGLVKSFYVSGQDWSGFLYEHVIVGGTVLCTLLCELWI